MSDDIIKRLRGAIAAGPTVGPWTMLPAGAGEQCVARINSWEAVPPNGVELAHDSIDANYIAAASPDNIAALLDRLDAAERENKSIRDILLRNGFVECDIPACNCGSWHHRYGLPERFHEIKDALADAGHEPSNANGNTTLGALNKLIEQRDAAEAENERLRMELAHEEQRVADMMADVNRVGHENEALREDAERMKKEIEQCRQNQ